MFGIGSSLFTLALFGVALIVIIRAIRVVPQQHAWIVGRLGRFYAVLEPGLNFVIPFVDRVAYRHDLREIPLENWGTTPGVPAADRPNIMLAPRVKAVPGLPQGPFVRLKDGSLFTIEGADALTSRDEGKSWQRRPLFGAGPKLRGQEDHRG